MNEAQVEAITTRTPNILVSAGAGSGKTSVLTRRYFHLLDDVVDGRKLRLDEILTLTFTRKAAQEMRERIARKLEDEGRSFERRELSRAPISTIHSFCESILREHALQAGIDPNFRLLDDAEASTLQENALDTIFEDLWEGTQQEREEIGRLVLEVPQRRLREGLLGIFRAARTRGLAIPALAPTPMAPLGPVATQFCSAIEDLLALDGTAKWQESLRLVQAAYDELRPRLTIATFSWDDYDHVRQAIKSLTPPGGPKELAKQARDAVKAAAADWLGVYLEQAAQPFLAAFLILLKRFDAAYQSGKDAQGLLDFEDLLLITRDLLLHEEGGARDRLRKKYRQIMVDEFQDTNPLQFSLISALQGDNDLFMVGDVKQAIYRFIGSDIRVFLAQERRVLDMGIDGKRIPMHVNYRTREEILEPLNGLFARLWTPENTEEGFTFEPLSAGREFTPKETPAIECAFWHNAETSAPELRDREARWIARRILQLTGTLGEKTLPVAAVNEDGEPCQRAATFGDFIILFRASSDVPLYEDALRRAGIPYYVVSGRGFYGTREVQDLMYFLRVLENPMDDFSVAVVLRSPLVGVSDDSLYWLTRDWREWSEGEPYPAKTAASSEYNRLWTNIARVEELPPIVQQEREALRRFRELILDLQPAMVEGQPLELIDAILARTGYTGVLLASDNGDQQYANVQKLREVAAVFQGRGIFDLSDFQRYLTQLSEQAPREASAPLDVEGSNVVRLMTIHAAKGLESPVVFLADCGREPNTVNDTFLLTADGLTCQVPSPEDNWEKPAAYQQAVARLAVDDRREAERLLYVALTRAKEHLICSGFTKYPEPEKRTRYADILAGLLGLEGPVADDTDIPVHFEETGYPVRVWSPASLRAVEELEPPAPPLTLWEEFKPQILAGEELPLVTRAEEVEHFTRVIDRLQPLPPPRRQGPLRIGVHRALCYDACPRQYWFRYVLGEDRLATPKQPPQEEDEQLVLFLDGDDDRERLDGTEFGKVLHAVMQRVDFSQPLIEQLPEVLEKLAVEESPIDVGDADQAHLADCLRRFMALPIYRALQQATNIQRELRFLAQEDGVFVPGIIDALVTTNDRHWIIDYKTGRPSANHLRQLALYALGVEHTLGVAPERVILVYIDEDGANSLRKEPVTPELLNEARRLIRHAAEGISAKAFHPTSARHCEYCPFAPACPQTRESLVLTLA